MQICNPLRIQSGQLQRHSQEKHGAQSPKENLFRFHLPKVCGSVPAQRKSDPAETCLSMKNEESDYTAEHKNEDCHEVRPMNENPAYQGQTSIDLSVSGTSVQSLLFRLEYMADSS